MESSKTLARAAVAIAWLSFAQANAQSLGEVVVTATRDERPAGRTLADVTTIDSADIERAAVSSVPELLRSLGGIEISQNGGNGATAGLFVRGTKTSQTVVLVDGVRLENPTSGTANLEFLSLASIERIEIVRGPISSLYGSGAMGGVIQIFTKQGSGPPTPTLTLGAGSHGTARWQAGISGAAGAGESTRYAISVSADRTGGYDVTRGDSPYRQDDRDASFTRGVNASLRQTLPRGWEIGATLLASRGRVFYDDAFSTPDSAKMNHRSSAISAFLRGRLSQDWRTELRVGDTRIDYRFDAFVFEPSTASSTIAWQNWVDLPLGRALFGIEQLRQRVDGEGVVTGPFAYLNDARRTDSVFAGYEIGLGLHLVRVQLRRDRIQTVGTEPTGTFAWGYQWSPSWLVRASVASAFRAPTFDDLYNFFGSNPSLRPERSRGAEIGVEYRAGATLARATAFTSRIRDAIELDASFIPRNLDDARVDGLAFEARHRVGDWSLRGAATFQNPRGARFDPATGDVVSGQLSRRAKQFGSFGLDWHPGPLRVGIEWIVQGRRVDSDRNEIAGYGVLNLHAALRIARDWEGFARFANLADKEYASALGFAMPPRGVFVGLRYRPR